MGLFYYEPLDLHTIYREFHIVQTNNIVDRLQRRSAGTEKQPSHMQHGFFYKYIAIPTAYEHGDFTDSSLTNQTRY